jgi:hypothetical protein
VQSKYIARYNLRSRDKHFEIGETVLILNPGDTCSRLWARCRAPVTIVDKSGDYSYLFEIDGSRQWILVNKLRKFDVRVEQVMCDHCFLLDTEARINACSIISEQDDDFGHVRPVELQVDHSIPSKRIDVTKLLHLNERQRVELFAVLNKYPEVFSEKPGLCSRVMHEI